MVKHSNKSAVEKCELVFKQKRQKLITFPKQRVDKFSAGNFTEKSAERFLFPSLHLSLSKQSNNSLMEYFTLMPSGWNK